MKILEIILYISIGFIISVILKNVLKKDDNSKQVESEVLIYKFKTLAKTPEFQNLLSSDDFKTVLKTEQFKDLGRTYGKQQFVNLLAG